MQSEYVKNQGCSYKKYGNMHCLIYKNRIFLTLGPHCKIYTGIFLVAFNLVILFTHLAFIFLILAKYFYLRVISFMCFSLLQFAYLFCALQNPGMSNPRLDIDLSETRYCTKCGSVDGGYHCNYCDVCIKGYDHHCGFIGKCVGEGNIKSFYFLLGSVFICITFMVLSLAWESWRHKGEVGHGQ
jgi:hypothetical protein